MLFCQLRARQTTSVFFLRNRHWPSCWHQMFPAICQRPLRELRDMALRDIEWHRPGFRSRTEWVRLDDFCHRTTVSVLIKSQWHYFQAYAWQPGAGQATTFGLWCGKIGPRFSAQTQGWLCWTEAGIMRSACVYGSSLGLCWVQVVPMLGQVGPIGPSWSPKPRKNRGFVTSPRWNSFPPKGPKHPKKR